MLIGELIDRLNEIYDEYGPYIEVHKKQHSLAGSEIYVPIKVADVTVTCDMVTLAYV